MKAHRKPNRMPGDLSKKDMLERMIRVDHAGEYGAVRIYEGQLAVLGTSGAAGEIEHMAAQERVLMPFWHIAGFALGAGTALMGEKAAHACTVAVEEVIDEHYAEQVAALDAEGDECELRDTFEKFRLEELEHRDTALQNGAEQAPGYEGLKLAVRAGSKLAIWLSKRV